MDVPLSGTQIDIQVETVYIQRLKKGFRIGSTLDIY